MSQPIVEKEAGPPAQVDTPVEEVPAEKKREYKDFGHDEIKATRMLSLRRFVRRLSDLTSDVFPPQMPMLTCQRYDLIGCGFSFSCADMMQIELKADDLYDKEKVDLETVVIEDVFTLLQCNDQGLTAQEGQRRYEIFGPNKLEQEEQNPFLQVGHRTLHFIEHLTEGHLVQFLSFMWNPLSWVMEAAALVAIALSNGEGRAPDWQDFCGITALLFANSFIGFYEERGAGNAVKALMDSLAPKAKVKRDGSWSEVDSALLVPGDIIAFKIGDIVPADCRLTEAINVSIDQAALTGESLPVSKKDGDQCFS